MDWLPYDEKTSMCSEYEYMHYIERFKIYHEPDMRIHSSVLDIIKRYYNMNDSDVFIEPIGPFDVAITEDHRIRVVLTKFYNKATIEVGYYDEAFGVYILDAEYNAKEHIANMAESVGATKV